MEGWIKLHRKLRENPLYSNSVALHCWIECLLRASHAQNNIFLKRQRISLKPGEFCMGRIEFGKSIGVSGSTAWFWILSFKADSMLDIKTSTKGTVVTINKWNEYQILDSKVDSRKTADEQRMNTNNNVKNVKNDNNNKPNVVKTSKNSLIACSEDEIVEIAKILDVSYENVKRTHEIILNKIESHEFKGKTIYYSLKNWVMLGLERGTIKKKSILSNYELRPTYVDKTNS